MQISGYTGFKETIREQLGDFSPMFAHLNDDVLFGEVWNEETISVKTKCMRSSQ